MFNSHVRVTQRAQIHLPVYILNADYSRDEINPCRIQVDIVCGERVDMTYSSYINPCVTAINSKFLCMSSATEKSLIPSLYVSSYMANKADSDIENIRIFFIFILTNCYIKSGI